ncbi:RDD family protein [Vibrio splendidus]|uniref:RDD family protein n=1 Tax=Vibrio TaxID=662 RepID=UPI00118F044D|nr:RDD family protein [Vibrio sp. A2-1]MCF7485742.1 RDD family protein [Vibrio sp. A2-1]TVU65044.1 RDD family protein [Vibrio atlanticus]
MSEVIENTPTIVLASRWSRVGASLIDGLIGIAMMTPIFLYTDYFQKIFDTGKIDTTELLIASAYGWLVFFLLHGYLLHKKGQTIGKNLMEIAIVDMEGKYIGLFKIVGKRMIPMTIVTYIPVIGHFITTLDCLFVLRKDKRCLHDLIAGTQVVSVSVPRNLDFSTIE